MELLDWSIADWRQHKVMAEIFGFDPEEFNIDDYNDLSCDHGAYGFQPNENWNRFTERMWEHPYWQEESGKLSRRVILFPVRFMTYWIHFTRGKRLHRVKDVRIWWLNWEKNPPKWPKELPYFIHYGGGKWKETMARFIMENVHV